MLIQLLATLKPLIAARGPRGLNHIQADATRAMLPDSEPKSMEKEAFSTL